MKSTVNQRIKEARNELNLNQAQFALGCNLSIGQISRLESDETLSVSSRTIKAIVDSYGISLEWLSYGKGEMFTNGRPSLNDNKGQTNPWKDALISEMKEEITYLRNALMSALGNKPNFRKATDVLRVAA